MSSAAGLLNKYKLDKVAVTSETIMQFLNPFWKFHLPVYKHLGVEAFQRFVKTITWIFNYSLTTMFREQLGYTGSFKHWGHNLYWSAIGNFEQSKKQINIRCAAHIVQIIRDYLVQCWQTVQSDILWQSWMRSWQIKFSIIFHPIYGSVVLFGKWRELQYEFSLVYKFF